MLSVENKPPAFNNLMSKETLHIYIFVQVTLTLNRWPWLNARIIKPKHYDWQLFQHLCSKIDFLLPWPWTWPNDLSTQTWPRYGSDLLTYQNEVNRSIGLKGISQKEKKISFWLPWPWTWSHDLGIQNWPRYCSDLLTYQIWGQ